MGSENVFHARFNGQRAKLLRRVAGFNWRQTAPEWGTPRGARFSGFCYERYLKKWSSEQDDGEETEDEEKATV